MNLELAPRALLRLAVVGLAVTLILTTSGDQPWPRSDAHIIVPGELRGAGIVYADTRPDMAYTIGDLIICLDRRGEVVIDRIEVKDPVGDLVLDAFAVIPNAMERGEPGFEDDNRTLAEQGLLPAGPVVIEKQCPSFAEDATPDPAAIPQSVALLLQYSKATQQTAGNRGIVIHYTSGGHKYWLSVPWQIMLCAPGDATTDMCRTQ